MGCDIHHIVEIFHDGQWVAEALDQGNFGGRNYTLFTMLANVRGDGGNEAKGFPDNASQTTNMKYEGWDMDAHSASWMMLEEAEYVYRKIKKEEWEWAQKEYADNPTYLNMYKPPDMPESLYDIFGVWSWEEEETPYKKRRVVFWFDN